VSTSRLAFGWLRSRLPSTPSELDAESSLAVKTFPARRKKPILSLRDTLRAEITDVGPNGWLAALHSSPDDQR